MPVRFCSGKIPGPLYGVTWRQLDRLHVLPVGLVGALGRTIVRLPAGRTSSLSRIHKLCPGGIPILKVNPERVAVGSIETEPDLQTACYWPRISNIMKRAWRIGFHVLQCGLLVDLSCLLKGPHHHALPGGRWTRTLG